MATKKSTSQKTNIFAVFGLVTSFLIPLAGLILSLVGLNQINKKKEKGKGLAVAGIAVSAVFMLLQLLLLIIIVVALKGSSIELATYTNNDIGYSVKYPEKWERTTNDTADVKDTIFKDNVDDSEKVRGQVEVVYLPPPKNKYTKDVLDAIANGVIDDNKDTNTESRVRSTKDGRPTLTMITNYKGEDGRVKAKTTVILNKNKSVYVVSTQSPEENWDKYQDSFNEIHDTFKP